MGCDIHAIIEIKRNGQWEYVPEIPQEFDSRFYGVFAMLNRNVRNSFSIPGFEGKGLPKDLSGRQFRFYSEKAYINRLYKTGSEYVCWIGGEDKKFINAYSPELTVNVTKELYNEVSFGSYPSENAQYFVSALHTHDYQLQDASKVNGIFRSVPYTVLYKDVYEFVAARNDGTYRVGDDLGYYEVDFDSDYHSASYLTLAELKTKMDIYHPNKTFIVETAFLHELITTLDELPEEISIKTNDDNTSTVMFYRDEYELNTQSTYNDGVNAIVELQQKYGVQDDEIRLVFAFDS